MHDRPQGSTRTTNLHLPFKDAASRAGTGAGGIVGASTNGVAEVGLTSADPLYVSSFEHASSLLEEAGAGLVVLGRDLEILATSSLAQQMLGEHLEVLFATSASHAEADEGFRALALRVQQTGTEEAFGCALVLGHASHRRYEVKCIPFGSGIALIVRADAESRSVSELHRSVVESAVSGIFVIDAAGRIQLVNRAAERLFGYSRGELMGCSLRMLIPAAQALRVPTDRSSQFAGGVGTCMAVRKDGSAFTVHLGVGEMVVAGQRLLSAIVTKWTAGEHVGEDAEVHARLLADHAAVRRVASAVASGMDLNGICQLVAEECANYLAVEIGLVCRFEDGISRVLGEWPSGPHIRGIAAQPVGSAALHQVARNGRSVRVDDDAVRDAQLRASSAAHDVRACVAAPVLGAHGIWGAVLAVATGDEPIAPRAEDRLGEFAELVGMAIANAADRALLVEFGAPDPLTGLANRHTFAEHVAGEVKRAKRHGYALSLAVVDIDGFTKINQHHGHPAGDRVLIEVARCLGAAAREGDLLARLGGDEFGWLLPYSDLGGAHHAADRVRGAVADFEIAGVGSITVSIGVGDLSAAHEARTLFAYADAALSQAKGLGGGVICRFEPPAPISASTDDANPESHRPSTPATVYALARSVDVKDPSTHEHSRRVADLAGQLASVLGWESARVTRLREAGLLYDVGKSGIPDSILLKSASLTPDEYAIAQMHVELGAEIIQDILTDEQVLWVRHHHERFDGSGYPDGLSGDRIPEGARILAVADSWDVMTTGRPYKTPLSHADALGEFRRLAGSQFCPDVVGALERLWDSGAHAQRVPLPD